MTFALAPEVSGTGLVVHDTIGSTSADAMERLRAGEEAPFWVVSRDQTAGRGRRGAAWSSPVGNLFASCALRLDLPPSTVATLGFVAGLAVVDALEAGLADAPQTRLDEVSRSDGTKAPLFRLKWPNDVLADGAKLVGILLETEETRQGRAVVIGIGVNVASAPEAPAYRTASLAGLGFAITPEAVFGRLSASLARAMATWDEGRGFASIRSAWIARAAGIGGPVSVKTGGSAIAGTFETIDPQGQMVVRLAGGEARSISAGDVYFGNAASLRAEAVA